MKLSQILNNVPLLSEDYHDEEITSIYTDSLKVRKNALFVAYRGVQVDGHDFIEDAIRNRASVIIFEDLQKPVLLLQKTYRTVQFIQTKNTRMALALMAANYYKTSVHGTKFIGVTGTNGKTTTTGFIYQILNSYGIHTGEISTVSARYMNKEINTGFHTTSPDPLALHRLIAQMQRAGVTHIIVETTSHALDQFRVYGLNFEVSAVTNITPEHLNYHGTFDNYVRTKLKIAQQSRIVLLNKYDPALKNIQELGLKNTKTIDFKRMNIPDGFSDRFPGRYNLENIGMAIAIVKIIVNDIVKKTENKHHPVSVPVPLESLSLPIGRFEFIQKDDEGVSVIVDYAHTPDSLKKVLVATRPLAKERLIVVFGHSGGRDFHNRPLLGEIAGRYADCVVVTSADPCDEKPEAIIKQIVAGIQKSHGIPNETYFIKTERYAAIQYAICEIALDGDFVLITGKGHETTVRKQGKEYPWSDQQAAREVLHLLAKNMNDGKLRN